MPYQGSEGAASEPARHRPPPHAAIPFRTRLAAWPNLLPLPVRFDPRNGVLLAGSPRSGTTWLGQILAASPRLCLVNEPFSPKMPGISKAGFSWRTHRDPEENWPEGEAIFRRVFSGRGVTVKLIRRNGLRLLRGDGVVVKEIWVNRLLPWIARRFDLRGIVVVIRHPCAVVSSQMVHFNLTHASWLDDLEYVDRFLPHRSGFVRGLETREERRALTWALDQHAALGLKGSRGWTLTSYEHLVASGAPEVGKIFRFLNLPVPERALDRLEQNSWQARHGSVDHTHATVEERLGVWRERLSAKQIERVLGVVEACGIPGFSDNALPDLAALTGAATPPG